MNKIWNVPKIIDRNFDYYDFYLILFIIDEKEGTNPTSRGIKSKQTGTSRPGGGANDASIATEARAVEL
jgi:hypothetical protein